MDRSYTAIIPAFNSESTIAQLLESLIKLESPPLEIIVVDDKNEPEKESYPKEAKI